MKCVIPLIMTHLRLISLNINYTHSNQQCCLRACLLRILHQYLICAVSPSHLPWERSREDRTIWWQTDQIIIVVVEIQDYIKLHYRMNVCAYEYGFSFHIVAVCKIFLTHLVLFVKKVIIFFVLISGSFPFINIHKAF